jgi:alpha-tubulin suppressor-like RCC1 family protein
LCWGSNSDGQLGNGFIIDSQVPVKVLGGEQGETYLTSVNVVSALNDYNCALSSGEVYCWGGNDYGQLGNNSTIYSSSVPVKVVVIRPIMGVNFFSELIFFKIR